MSKTPIPNPDPFIVAEISCNHNGSLDRAVELINSAAKAGADAVKFQAYDPFNMVADRSYVLPAGPWEGRNLYDLYTEAATPYDWFPTLFDVAASAKIEAFASVFDIEGLAMLERLNCPRYKIASFEITDIPLIRAVAETGKPMIISTGIATTEDAHAAVRAASKDLTMLLCTSAYPADPAEIGLQNMVGMKKWWGCKVGISDHTKGIGVAIAATALGAQVIEKHLVNPGERTLDSDFSLPPDQFEILVNGCREARKSLNPHTFGPSKGAMRFLRRSLWTIAPVAAGEAFTHGNVAARRIDTGMPPIELRSVFRCRAARDLPAGVPLIREMLIS